MHDTNSAESIVQHLGGKWFGRYGVAPCPVCQPQARRDQSALTVTDGGGRLLLNCKRSGCDFTDILHAAGISEGAFAPPASATVAQRKDKDERLARRKAMQAQICWDEGQPIHGTPAEVYLRARGISCELPSNLRYHPECWHSPSARRLPALVAQVSPLHGSAAPAIHRTYLKPDGCGKAEVSPAKMMLGATAGGAVRLSRGAGPLVACEGLETGLSLLSGLLNGPAQVVATLSTSGMKSLALPPTPGDLLLAPDGDCAGREAAEVLGARAIASGWRVSRLRDLPDSLDWNDVLRGVSA